MKKLIFLLPLFLLLQSCENDEPKDIFGDSSNSQKGNYTVYFNANQEEFYRSELGNYYSSHKTNIFINEYNSDNEIVAAHLWKDVKYKESKTFTANKRAIKLVIGYKTEIHSTNGRSATISNYIANVFYLDEYNYIEITGTTLVSSSSPID